MKITGGLRFRVCPDCGDMHDRDDWPNNHRRPGYVLSAPSVIGDEMAAVQSQANGRMYDSKSNMRKSYEPSGNPEGKKYIEIGNDQARHKPFKRPKHDRKLLKQSIEKAEARFNRGERVFQK